MQMEVGWTAEELMLRGKSASRIPSREACSPSDLSGSVDAGCSLSDWIIDEVLVKTASTRKVAVKMV